MVIIVVSAAGGVMRSWVLTGEPGGPLRLTMLNDVMQAFAGHGVRPVIDRSFGFGDAPAAFDHLREARHVGKVIIEL
jgi:NADPH:quinone reductase-like Zn-dependent oxidoreductase